VVAQSRISWKDRQWHGKAESETFRKEGGNIEGKCEKTPWNKEI
jgi:hypothetical protein